MTYSKVIKTLVFSAVLWMPISAVGQNDSLKQQLFQEADEAIQAAKTARAHVLAPKSFGNAMQAYNNATEDFNQGGDLNTIRGELQQAVNALREAVEGTKLAEVSLTDAIQARTDAHSADAAQYAATLWQEAESLFSKAAATLEGGNVKNAQKRGSKAESAYREAELGAIKANYLNETRTLLERAVKLKAERYAPKTLQKSQQLLTQAEKALNEDRYDTDAPRGLAKQAKYEAKHAIYVSEQLQAVKKGEKSQEDLYLEQEVPVIMIAEAADIVPALDSGYEQTTNAVIEYIDNIRSKSYALSEDVSVRKQRIREMEQQITQLETKLGGASAESKALKQRIANEVKVQQTFAAVEQKFDRKSAEVFRQGNNVIMRLVGLNFAVGKSGIDTKNFALLKQVKEAIQLFPIDKVIVEGHTDSYGGDASNLKLSQDRAIAVREYLLANMDIKANHVEAVGYGETRPVANNETSDGRRKNRRIDIVIQPKL